jgi:hypothetical protein
LIAILEVGEIHQAWTPENVAVESATARVEKVLWYQMAADPNIALPDTITVYRLEPNADIQAGRVFSTVTGSLKLEKGRVLAVLQMRGMNKFAPFWQFSMQPLKSDQDTVDWPAVKEGNPGFNQLTLKQLVEEIERLKRSPEARKLLERKRSGQLSN